MVAKIIEAIVSAFTGLLTGTGGAMVEFFDTAVLTAEGELTTFAVWVLAFLGIGAAFGVTKLVTHLIRR